MPTDTPSSGLIVAKFGGSSVATAEQLRKVQAIVEADPRRRVIVPSAPGKAFPDDTKVTDLLYLVHQLAKSGQDIAGVWSSIETRFLGIIAQLDIECDLRPHLDAVRERILAGADDHYVASRGEALHGHIVAALLGAEYVDAADVIRFGVKRELDPSTYDLVRERLSGPGRYVLPGFYGADKSGTVRTFSRGGSDVSGSIAAAALGAEVYENWTDVSGVLRTDPRVVPEAASIPEITYKELRELAYMGASVLHEEAVFPVRQRKIPINIRNTNRPEDPGTMILDERDTDDHLVTGIAGSSGFTAILIEKEMMNGIVGFGRRVLDVLERLGINYEHSPSGIDTFTLIIDNDELGDLTDQVVEDLKAAVHPERVTVNRGMALIATVGQGMNRQIGTAARLFQALAAANVNIRMIDQGSSEQNIIVGVEEADLTTAIRAIYDAFIAE